MKFVNRINPPAIINITFVTFIIIYWQVSYIFLRHHDIGWHIAAGQQIRELGKIPEYDSWSFTAGDTPWMNVSWLWDVMVSKIYEVGGFAPLVSITIILGATICALLISSCLLLEINVAIAFIGTLFVGLIFPFYQPPWDYVLSVAPQSVSLLFFLIFYIFVLEVIKNNYFTKKVWTLPLLMILWTSMHGAFLLGFMIIGSAFFASIFEQKIEIAKKLIMLGGLCALASLVNPLGIHIVDLVVETLTCPCTSSITEWQPFEFGKEKLSTAYALLFILVMQWKNSNIPLFCRIVGMICLIAGLLQRRHFVYFLFASLPLFLVVIQTWLSQSNRILDYILDIEKDLKKKKIAIFSSLCAIFSFFFVQTPFAMDVRFPAGISLPKEFYPEEEISYLRSRISNKNSEPIFNHWNFGGYLIFSLKDKAKVYIDGRANTAYPLSLLDMPMMKSYENIEKNANIRFAIMPNYQPLSQIYFRTNPNWKVAFTGNVGTIFEKRTDSFN